ncbi:MAG: hypothetical protein AAGH83_05155, partial [Pseudomonadota bacterium]
GLAAILWFVQQPGPADVDVADHNAPPATQTDTAPVAPQAAEDPSDTAGLPRVDLVRVEPDGSALVAGQASPGARVRVVVDGRTEGEATADGAGQFAAFVTLAQADRAQIVWLIAEGADGRLTTSEDRVIVANLAAEHMTAEALTSDEALEAPDDGTARSTALATRPPGSTVADAAPETAPEAPQAVQAPDADAVATAAVTATPRLDTAPPVLRSDQEGVRLLSPPRLSGGDALRIDTISYSAGDEVILRGRSGGAGDVRLSFGDDFTATVATGADGAWEARIPGLPPGDYALRAERLDDLGQVAASVGVPFRRAGPDEVAALQSGPEARLVTVQPGATLWAIARDRYGDPLHYVHVYDANDHLIEDPDLIFPGQVFELPNRTGATDAQ